jgi:hypothetical protein
MWTIKSTSKTVLTGGRRYSSQLSGTGLRREFKVVLDNNTLYVDQTIAEALGWKPDTESKDGVPLTLTGWSPHYFTIARTGTDSGISSSVVLSLIFWLIYRTQTSSLEGQ